jgi:hypothetical protein
MAEPFPDIPSWLVWVIIVFVILIGTMCIATLITGIYTGKWWLLIPGVISCAVCYLKVFSRIFPDIRKFFK